MSDRDHESAPIIRIACTIIKEAIVDGASEIKLEAGSAGAIPFEGVEAALKAMVADGAQGNPEVRWLKVWYKVGGDWREVMPLPDYVREPLTCRFKVMADMDLAVTDKPQTGRIPICYSGTYYTVFLETRPDAVGEQLLMRVSPGNIIRG